MNECECLPGCPFFHDKMDNMPAMADIFKNRYCLGDHFTCARHRIFESLGRDRVPHDMFPNDGEYADTLLVTA
ncbi:MAG: hypothetical protein CVT67_01405 [Actinobacteria bacterium HGW-Actinobacteria-7]|jgi:hypothetical protein|nr:MAG: hypothetical protein CVT67_01405 [Actinobacteria bacterium HGW-Actinobacteria-7]